MLRISSFLLATLYVALTYFFHRVIETSFPEASVSAMIVTIFVYILVSWGYLHYSFLSFSQAIESNHQHVNSILTLLVFSLAGVVTILVSYHMTKAVENFPELAYGLNVFLIFISNFKTSIYHQYKAINDKRKLSGLKSL